jgi:golgi phosphoprotein 3
MDIQPDTEPRPAPRPRSRTKKAEIKTLELNLPEKLFILTIDDEQGAVTASVKTTLRYGLAGALLAELALANNIQIEDERLLVLDPTPSGDALFDDLLALLAAEKKTRKLNHWIRIVGNKQTVKQVADRLSARNVIVIEKKRYTWISPYIVYPLVDASAKYWVKLNLRGMVLAGEKAEASDIYLLSLLKACNLLRLVFTHDERKSAAKKVDMLVQGEALGESVANLLTGIEAAASN